MYSLLCAITPAQMSSAFTTETKHAAVGLSIDASHIVDADTQFIAHQCNCARQASCANLGHSVFRSFEFADIYGGPQKGKKGYPSVPAPVYSPGTIEVRKNPTTGPHVINMMAQVNAGMPKVDGVSEDTSENRVKWFQQCLDHMKELQMKSVAFPDNIGCDVAGGSWPVYKKMIEGFAEKNPKTRVVLCSPTAAAPRKLSFGDC